MKVTSYNARFLRKEQITKDAWKFYFRKPKSFAFIAGQYLKMKLPIKNPDLRGNSRYFTISSSPTEKDLSIITKIGKSSFKKALIRLKIGEKVQIRGPWGDFVLPEKSTKKLIFLAGGIGFTPFRSILTYVSDSKLSVPIFMINSYSDKKAAELATVLEEFKDISGFKLEIMLQRITADLLHKYLDEKEKYVYYISGPERMVNGLASDLKKQGVKGENIKLDDFPGYKISD